jgi:3'-phosphoadenosine 5'-phosphosulfate sulfotransferase (PAPS reductase)/FAD synthetase
VVGVIERAGFVFDPADVVGHVPSVYRLREAFGAKPVYDFAFDGIVPFTIRAERGQVTDEVESAFRRHRNIAFQYSGGRDSTAALFKLRDRWDRMTVYHLDTGDQFPELREVVDAVDKLLPRPMVRIATDVKASRVEHGFPSDLVPVDNTPVGRLVSGRHIKIVSRYDCCAHNLMVPMHRRMLADGMTLIVRGQRDAEYAQAPMRSGQVSPEGLEVLYPIQDWSSELVDQFLRDEGAPVAPFYARGMKRAPECMGCTAWWDEGRLAYMREHHPEAFDRVSFRVNAVHAEIRHQLAQLEA